MRDLFLVGEREEELGKIYVVRYSDSTTMSEAYWKERAERLEAALQAVADESRTLRQCGPYEEDALDLHNALERAVNLACGALAQQHDVPRTVYELWESVERNQCDGCARGLPIDEHGIHRGEGYDVIVCTADRYAHGDGHE